MDETLEGIGLFSHVLEILNINNNHTTCFSFSIPLFLELCQNNFHTLSLTKCKLSSEATSSLSGVATPGRARATYASTRATELVLEHVANSVSIFLLVFIAKCLFRAVCLPSAAVKIRLLT